MGQGLFKVIENGAVR